MNAKLFDNMMRFGIGVDPWFWERNTDGPNYPPHNIEQTGEDQFRLTLAVAGFSRDEMQITVENDLLTVKGWKGGPRADDPSSDIAPINGEIANGHRVLYKGIAFRDWNRQFKIGEHVRVANAIMENGLLLIDLVREIPEAQKPKLIQITT